MHFFSWENFTHVGLRRIPHDFCMVKGQFWQCRQWKPLGICCVILASDLDGLINDSEVCHCDGAASWVAVYLGVCANLVHIGYSETRFFLQFPNSTFLCGLIHIHESARECPAAFVWICASLD